MHKPGDEDGTRRVLGNVNGSQGPGKGEMMRSRAMWMGEGVGVVKRAEARRGACVRAWLRGCRLDREHVFGLGCVAAAPREADVAEWPPSTVR